MGNMSGRMPTRGSVSTPQIVTEKAALIKDPFDYIGVTSPDGVTDVYTFRAGGATGTVVATLTIIYTDSTKVTLSSLART